MHKTFDFKKYVEYKVYSVTTIKPANKKSRLN